MATPTMKEDARKHVLKAKDHVEANPTLHQGRNPSSKRDIKASQAKGQCTIANPPTEEEYMPILEKRVQVPGGHPKNAPIRLDLQGCIPRQLVVCAILHHNLHVFFLIFFRFVSTFSTFL